MNDEVFSYTFLRDKHHVERRAGDVHGTGKGVSERYPAHLKQIVDVGESKSVSGPLPTKMEFRPPHVRVTVEDDRNARQCPLCVFHRRHQFLPERRAALIMHSDVRSIE